jgi:hypothetical protein
LSQPRPTPLGDSVSADDTRRLIALVSIFHASLRDKVFSGASKDPLSLLSTIPAGPRAGFFLFAG